ncbi:diguanylate cyclase [Rhodoferax sp.]|uniref:GGDEF domain-containing protein n=1 Tax=Rhodoferax sp. TaxID=50421 RepID=UPI002719A386|nr:diguanylate cyclase [Rhodoferax sp.]MDO8319602.1 diguanylate cyclase [Rhodoferax sp.]
MLAHVPTLFMVIMALSATLALSVGIAARTQLREGMAYWALGLFAHTLAYLLFALRGQVSDWLSVVLGNLLLSVVFALFAEGVFQFQRRRPPRWLLWTPCGVVVVLFAALLPWYLARVVVGALIYVFQSLVVVLAVLQKRKETAGVGQYFLVTGFLVLVALTLLQGVGVVLHRDQITSVLSAHWLPGLVFLTSALCTVVVSVGLILMGKERADERNRTLAMRDALTGLVNRRSLLEALTQQMAHARRHGQPLALLMIDIDYFKRVNDSHGHLSGDKVLKTVAGVIAARTRAQDLPGRLGGEEFLVILPGTTLQGALQLAETLRQEIEHTGFCSVSGEVIALTISLGVCAQDQLVAPLCDDMINAADQALYLAKNNGRNRVGVFAPISLA